MLERVACHNAVVMYRSPLLAAVGVPHGFSTRLGGVSGGPFESMNLGNPSGCDVRDSTANITENYRRLHAAIRCENRRRVFAHQVHGAIVLDPATDAQTDSIHGGCEIGKGDALVTTDPLVLLSVRTADCVPVLLADTAGGRGGRRVAACHAGWRGVAAGVVIEALKRFDDPTRVIAAIGPAIGFGAFEVGPEVAAVFEKLLDELGNRVPGSGFRVPGSEDGPLIFLPDTRNPEPGTRPAARVDLRGVLALQLRAAGVPADAIDTTDRCTVTHADEFFSHRREHGRTGRMAAVIGVAHGAGA